jgi:hypothetical protein
MLLGVGVRVSFFGDWKMEGGQGIGEGRKQGIGRWECRWVGRREGRERRREWGKRERKTHLLTTTPSTQS